MQKLKSLNLSGFLNLLKSALVGIVATLIGIVFFAIILKFVDMNSIVVNTINDIIKAISIFFMVFVLKKAKSEKLILKAILSSLIYTVLSFIVFSIMNGGFRFNLSIVYDLLFGIVVSAIVAVILNLTSKKTA